MEKKNAVLIVEEENQLFGELQKVNSGLTPVKARYCDVHETLTRVSPQAVIFNLDHQKEEVRKILSTFYKTHPQTHWIISGGELTKEELIDFMRLGVSDYFEQPLKEQDKAHLIEKLMTSQKSEMNESKGSHRILTFFSAKGGVGLSLGAVNLAVNLAKRNLERVLLVDLVLQHGNIAEMLDISRTYTVHDVMENLDRIDVKLMEQSLQKHPSGIFVLPCPKQPEDAETFNVKETSNLLKLFKEAFNYTVVDAGHELNTASISCLDMADTIFLMTTPDLPSLCNLRTVSETFNKLGYKKEKIKIMLNRKGMKGEIDAGLIEKNLGRPIDYQIPDDSGTALSAVNQGIALNQVSKTAEIVKAFERLSDGVASGIKKAA